MKHHNQQYDGDVPIRTSDRYYAQDRVLDFRSLQDFIGQAIGDIGVSKGSSLPFIISGGVVSQGTGDTLSITAGYGYAKFSVEIPDDFASLPPSKVSQDLTAVRIEWDAQNSIAISSAVLDGVTTNYVKVIYNEEDGNTRTKAKSSGSYAYEVSPSYSIVVNSTAPTDYDVLLATLVGSSGGTFTITDNRTFLGQSAIDISSTDLDVLDITGFYSGDNLTHSPDGSTDGFYIEHLEDGSLSYAKQIGTHLSNGQIYWRLKISGSWGGWVKIWNASNDGSGSGLNADLLRGYEITSGVSDNSNWGRIPYVRLDGVMTVGKQIYFGETDGGYDDQKIYVDGDFLKDKNGYKLLSEISLDIGTASGSFKLNNGFTIQWLTATIAAGVTTTLYYDETFDYRFGVGISHNFWIVSGIGNASLTVNNPDSVSHLFQCVLVGYIA